MSLSGIHCGTHRGPDSVCVKAPFPLDHPGFLIRHSQAMWRLLKRRIFTKEMMSFCNDEYMNVLFHHCTGKILDAVFLHTLLKNVPQLNRF